MNNKKQSNSSAKYILILVFAVIISFASHRIVDKNIVLFHSPTYDEINYCNGFPIAIYCQENVSKGIVGVSPINETTLYFQFVINTVFWFALIYSLPYVYAFAKTKIKEKQIHSDRGNRRVG